MRANLKNLIIDMLGYPQPTYRICTHCAQDYDIQEPPGLCPSCVDGQNAAKRYREEVAFAMARQAFATKNTKPLIH